MLFVLGFVFTLVTEPFAPEDFRNQQAAQHGFRPEPLSRREGRLLFVHPPQRSFPKNSTASGLSLTVSNRFCDFMPKDWKSESHKNIICCTIKLNIKATTSNSLLSSKMSESPLSVFSCMVSSLMHVVRLSIG